MIPIKVALKYSSSTCWQRSATSLSDSCKQSQTKDGQCTKVQGTDHTNHVRRYRPALLPVEPAALPTQSCLQQHLFADQVARSEQHVVELELAAKRAAGRHGVAATGRAGRHGVGGVAGRRSGSALAASGERRRFLPLYTFVVALLLAMLPLLMMVLPPLALSVICRTCAAKT